MYHHKISYIMCADHEENIYCSLGKHLQVIPHNHENQAFVRDTAKLVCSK